MSDLRKTIQRALKELTAKRARVEKAIKELERLKLERTHILKAIADLEDALEHVGSTPRRKRAVVRKPRTQARRAPTTKTTAAKPPKKTGKKKKAPQSNAWTPAKRRAMAARMRKIWATRRKKR
jgi:predicted  nucleic acid-binding Zn-ribbon protein